MLPINFAGTNATLSKPANLTDEQCGTLHAYKAETFRGTQWVTAWQPSYEDIEAFNKNKALIIQLHLPDVMWAAVNSRYIAHPPMIAVAENIVWVPGANEVFDIKSGCPIYFHLVCAAFPVITVYVQD